MSYLPIGISESSFFCTTQLTGPLGVTRSQVSVVVWNAGLTLREAQQTIKRRVGNRQANGLDLLARKVKGGRDWFIATSA